MPSTILSDNGVSSGTSGIKTTGSNDGALALQTTTAGGTATTALSIDTSQNVTFAGAVTNPAGTVSAPSITFTGDTNTGLFSPGADTVGVTTGGSERMRIDSSGLVGVGTTSLNARLNSKAVGNSYTNGCLALESSAGTKQYITTISDVMYFGTSASADMAVFSANGIGLAGNVPTSGLGLKFPATQSASSDANTLDDYEEGTWTPTDASGAGLSFTLTGTASYVKIGRVCTATCFVTYPSTANGSIAYIGGFPFTFANINNLQAGSISNTNYGTAITILGIGNDTRVAFTTFADVNITNANLSTKFIRLSFTYITT